MTTDKPTAPGLGPNPYASDAFHDYEEWNPGAAALAHLAVAYELRTANLIAYAARTSSVRHRQEIARRLGLDPATGDPV